MSDETETGEDVPVSKEREEVLALLDEAMDEAHRKVTSGRVYDAEKEKTRQGWFRTLGYLANQYRSLKKDRDELEEIHDRLEALENGDGSEESDFQLK